jgi:transketolase
MGNIAFPATFSSFISQRGCDQAVNAVAYNKFNVKIIGTYGGLTSEKNGGTHIGVEDIAIFRSMPNMVVISPGDCVELKQVLFAAVSHEGPMFLRLPKGPLKTFHKPDYKFEIGKAVKLQDGNDVALITSDITTAEGIKASEILSDSGISVYHLHMPTIKPIDKEAILEAAERTKKIFTVENHSIYGGLGSAVAEVIAESGCAVKVIRLGIQDCFGETGTLDWLMKKFKIDSDAIVEAVKNNG